MLIILLLNQTETKKKRGKQVGVGEFITAIAALLVINNLINKIIELIKDKKEPKTRTEKYKNWLEEED